MNDYRKIKEKKLNKGICEICNYPYYPLIVHHINGDRKNNKKENLIVACYICHRIIHKGFTHLNRNLKDETAKKLINYRGIWLLNIKKWSKKETEERLKYEWIICKQSNSYLKKNKCYICHSKRDLKLFCHPLIEKYSPNPKKYSVALCKKCLKDW